MGKTALTLEYKRKIGEVAGKSILMPNAASFGDLFRRWRKFVSVDEKLEGWGPWTIGDDLRLRDDDRPMQVSSYCAMYGTPLQDSLRVVPNQDVLDLLRKNLVLLENDTIWFQVVDRKDGVLITAKYNNIIGSRWLALLERGVYGEISQGLK